MADKLEDYGESNSGGTGKRLRVDVEGFLTGTAQTITSSAVTSSGTVTAGATSVAFTTSSDFGGTINGVARAVSTTYIFSAAVGYTLPAIAYTRSAGTLTIDKIV